ncbi:cytochrome P450 [Favolaschia claudopus]|uniref:Cytochrome P450 n=1 Tax=Favolaschia claudopus TaxID=2862362 RepID=A0AAW0CZI0_9AGAR
MPYSFILPVVVLVLVVAAIYRRRRNSIAYIQGPSAPSWMFGHMQQLLLAFRYGEHEFQWLKAYGSVYRLKGCLGQNRLMVSDPVALQYIVNSAHFYRSPLKDNISYLLFGEKSVITATGSEHRRLRSALNVGFTSAAVRKYQPVFKRIAETISEELERNSEPMTDICPLLCTAALGAISEAIMGVPQKDLGQEFVDDTIQIVKSSATQTNRDLLVDAVGFHLPGWFWRIVMRLPTATFNTARTVRSLATEIGGRIVREKIDATRKGLEINQDLFSRLVNPESPTESSKMLPEEDIVAHTALIVIAGLENTANALSFGLLELARHPEFQRDLRTEIHSSPRDADGNIPYDTMPLLNAFVKETLRLYPGLPLSDRVVVEDTVIPLGESICTRDGIFTNQIPVSKGQLVTIAIASYQRSLPSVWGNDAHEFNPYRWIKGAVHQGEAVGPYANLLTFLGGPRTCLGWRFAVSEMQIVFCELVGKFSFAETDTEATRPRFMTSLQPIAENGRKGLPLRIIRTS